MVTYNDEGVVQLSIDQLWRFLDLHLDDRILPAIHPDTVAQRTLRRAGNESDVERTIRFLGRNRRSVWRLTYDPPTRARWEVIDGDGPIKTGSFLDNTYEVTPQGTLLRSRGEVSVTTFPGFLQPKMVRSALDQVTEEDLAYLRANPL